MNNLTFCAFGKEKFQQICSCCGIMIVVSADDTVEILDFTSVTDISLKVISFFKNK